MSEHLLNIQSTEFAHVISRHTPNTGGFLFLREWGVVERHGETEKKRDRVSRIVQELFTTDHTSMFGFAERVCDQKQPWSPVLCIEKVNARLREKPEYNFLTITQDDGKMLETIDKRFKRGCFDLFRAIDPTKNLYADFQEFIPIIHSTGLPLIPLLIGVANRIYTPHQGTTTLQ